MSVSETPRPTYNLEQEVGGTLQDDAPPGEVRLRLRLTDLHDAAGRLHSAGARFVTVLRAETPEPAVVAVFALRGDLVLLRVALPDSKTADYTSITRWWPAARWPEQELAECHGVTVSGRSASRRLTTPDADQLDEHLSGPDVFSIPYGPVRSGVFEAIQFHIETGGEDVLHLETRPYFKHRGLEGRFVGLDPECGVHVAERVAATASVAYATAFCQAVERALGVQVPPRASRWRVVHAELERIANHLDVIAKEAETTALYVGTARFQILKEQIMRLRAALCGSRFGRGVATPGGVRLEGQISLHELSCTLDAFERDLGRDQRLFLGTASMTDRLIGAGHLPREAIERHSAVGPLARGSGVSTDARHERPYGAYEHLGVEVITAREGDAMARINVRFGELHQSLRLLRGCIDQLGRRDGELLTGLPAAGSATALGWAEAPQGELVIWVELRDGVVHRVHIASPSQRNWGLFEQAFPKDVLTDFAFIEHSFGLTPAGADR